MKIQKKNKYDERRKRKKMHTQKRGGEGRLISIPKRNESVGRPKKKRGLLLHK